MTVRQEHYLCLVKIQLKSRKVKHCGCHQLCPADLPALLGAQSKAQGMRVSRPALLSSVLSWCLCMVSHHSPCLPLWWHQEHGYKKLDEIIFIVFNFHKQELHKLNC